MPFGPKANGPIDCIVAAVSCALEARGAEDVNPVAAASKVTADSLANTRISNSLSRNRPRSGEDFRHNTAGDISQPEVATAITIRQLGVIDPEQVQDRGMEVKIGRAHV